MRFSTDYNRLKITYIRDTKTEINFDDTFLNELQQYGAAKEVIMRRKEKVYVRQAAETDKEVNCVLIHNYCPFMSTVLARILRRHVDVPVYLFVGCMMWYKGLKIVFHGLRRLKEDRKPFRLVMIGKGKDKKEMEEYVEEALRK